MAKNSEKVSVTAFEKIVDNCSPSSEILEIDGVSIKVKKTISVSDMMNFVNTVVTSCFSKDGGYIPEAFDFSVRLNVLEKYADISLPSNISKRYDFAYSTVYDMIEKKVSERQLFSIVSAAREKVDYICETNTNKILADLTRLVNAFESIEKNMSESFDGVSSDNINNFISIISSLDSVDEEKLARAIIDASEN